MKLADIETFWDSLDREQKGFIKDLLSFITVKDTKKKILDKILAKPMPSDSIHELNISKDLKDILVKNKFRTVTDIEIFGYDNLKELSDLNTYGYITIYSAVKEFRLKSK